MSVSARQPCSPAGNWSSGNIGDCSQHLALGECPAVSSVDITHRGGAYSSIPIVMFSGGGQAATGAYGLALMSCSGSGVVTGVKMLASGWHFTESPTVIFSGTFATAAAQTSGCMHGTSVCNDKTLWNDPVCMCSGSGNIFGHPIYENVTLMPPQCSNFYQQPNWQDYVNSGILPECKTGCLHDIGTNSYGQCKVDGTQCDCVTTFQSGWVPGDCAAGTWQKTDNYCLENGSFAPSDKCAGPWTPCGKPIQNKWKQTNQFLDFGVCTKRGFKNVVAMKSWHGEPPFSIVPKGCNNCATCATCSGASDCHTCSNCSIAPDGSLRCDFCRACSNGDTSLGIILCSGCASCSQCPIGEQNFSQKYLESIFTYSDNVSVTDTVSSLNYGYHVDATVIATVDRNSSQVNGEAIVNAQGKNEFFKDGIPLIGANFLDRCNQTLNGFPISGFNDFPWNYTLFSECDVGYGRTIVSTTASINDTTISFHQQTDIYIIGCRTHDYHYSRTIDAITTLSSPYTTDQLNDDVDALLNQWNLTNDLIYPWRTDDDENIMPKVTRCEGGATSPLVLGPVIGSDCPNHPACNYTYRDDSCSHSWNSCQGRPECPSGAGFNAFFSSTCHGFTGGCLFNCTYNGGILGAPEQVGRLLSIDFNRNNPEDLPCSCEGDDDGTAITIRSWGGVAPLAHVTQWPTYREKQAFYPGAFASFNDDTRLNTICNGSENSYISQETMIKAKWAEVIQMDKPSENFRMPCGIGNSKDMIYINETDGSVVPYLTVPTGCMYGCECTPCGTGTAIACTNGPSPLRWPKNSGIGFVCNTALSITSGEIQTGKINIYLISGHSGVRGQYVNAHLTFGGSAFLDDVFLIEAILSPSGFSISGNFSPYLGHEPSFGGWIDFATGNDWFDNFPKGEFLVRNWNFHPITGNGFNQQADPYASDITVTSYCLPWKPCDPAMVIIGPSGSPESVTSRNVKFITMPRLTPHPCGAKFNYIPQQWKTDPLWLRPSKPCCLTSGLDNPDCSISSDDDDDLGIQTFISHRWEEDDGSCRDVDMEVIFGDAISIIYHHHFPMRPWVEARASFLGPYILPSDGCSFLTYPQYLNATNACLSIPDIEDLDSDVYTALTISDWGSLSCLCQTPSPGSPYWGSYAPWKVSANQEGCLRAADNPT